MSIYRLNQKVAGGGVGGSGGISDYTDLSNKPQINSVTLSGDKSGADLGLVEVSQGVSEAGKLLGVDANGNVTTVNKPQPTVVDGVLIY